jgi:glutamyl aminopeptidase
VCCGIANANSNDLWIAMSNATTALGRPMDVMSIMQGWTLKMGYPYLQVVEGSDGKLSATQHRFLTNGGTGPLPEYKWDISINSITDTGESRQQWLYRGDASITFTSTLPSTNGWFKADSNETGFYRVNYPAKYWDLLDAAMKRDDSRLGAPDRMGLIDDAFALAHAKVVPVTQALNMTAGLASETSFNVWTVAVNHLVSLDYLLRTQPDYDVRSLRAVSVVSMLTLLS